MNEWSIDCGSFSGSLAIFFWLSDCTPKHLFVDPAPACEEAPDLFGRHVNIRYSTALRGMTRPNQTDVVAGWCVFQRQDPLPSSG